MTPVADSSRRFDPVGLLATLDRHRVAYIVVGAFGRVVQGAEEVTRGVDIVPSPKPDNLERLDAALEELEAVTQDGQAASLDATSDDAVLAFSTNRGELKVVPRPEG